MTNQLFIAQIIREESSFSGLHNGFLGISLVPSGIPIPH